MFKQDESDTIAECFVVSLRPGAVLGILIIAPSEFVITVQGLRLSKQERTFRDWHQAYSYARDIIEKYADLMVVSLDALDDFFEFVTVGPDGSDTVH